MDINSIHTRYLPLAYYLGLQSHRSAGCSLCCPPESLLLVGRTGSLSRCLSPVQPARAAVVLIGMALSLCCQLFGSAAETMGVLVCVVIFPSPRGRSHFIMVPVPWGHLQGVMGQELLWRNTCRVGWVEWGQICRTEEQNAWW